MTHEKVQFVSISRSRQVEISHDEISRWSNDGLNALDSEKNSIRPRLHASLRFQMARGEGRGKVSSSSKSPS